MSHSGSGAGVWSQESILVASLPVPIAMTAPLSRIHRRQTCTAGALLSNPRTKGTCVLSLAPVNRCTKPQQPQQPQHERAKHSGGGG